MKSKALLSTYIRFMEELFKAGKTTDEIVLEVYSMHNRIKCAEIGKMKERFRSEIKSGYTDFLWSDIVKRKRGVNDT